MTFKWLLLLACVVFAECRADDTKIDRILGLRQTETCGGGNLTMASAMNTIIRVISVKLGCGSGNLGDAIIEVADDIEDAFQSSEEGSSSSEEENSSSEEKNSSSEEENRKRHRGNGRKKCHKGERNCHKRGRKSHKGETKENEDDEILFNLALEKFFLEQDKKKAKNNLIAEKDKAVVFSEFITDAFSNGNKKGLKQSLREDENAQEKEKKDIKKIKTDEKKIQRVNALMMNPKLRFNNFHRTSLRTSFKKRAFVPDNMAVDNDGLAII